MFVQSSPRLSLALVTGVLCFDAWNMSQWPIESCLWVMELLFQKYPKSFFCWHTPHLHCPPGPGSLCLPGNSGMVTHRGTRPGYKPPRVSVGPGWEPSKDVCPLCSGGARRCRKWLLSRSSTLEIGYRWRSNKGWREVSFLGCLLHDWVPTACHVKGFYRGPPMSSSQSSCEPALSFYIF